MASVYFLERGELFSVSSINKWRDWTDPMVDDQCIGLCIRKIKCDGHAFCIRCLKEMNYSSKGKMALEGPF